MKKEQLEKLQRLSPCYNHRDEITMDDHPQGEYVRFSDVLELIKDENLPISDVRVSTVYILCAGIWYQDGKEHKHQMRNIDSGFVVAGRRHHNCFITSYILSKKEFVNEQVSKDKWKVVQGFITSDDRFVDRKEGGQIAFEAGQTKELKECLFSEDLY